MIPKFSIRQLLLMMIAIGVISACMAGASRGNRVAFGLSVAIIGTILPFTALAVVHWMSLALASFAPSINGGRRGPAGDSPSPVSLATVPEAATSQAVQVETNSDQAGQADA